MKTPKRTRFTALFNLDPDRYIAPHDHHILTGTVHTREEYDNWLERCNPESNKTPHIEDIVANATKSCLHCRRQPKEHIGKMKQCPFQPSRYKAFGLERVGPVWRRFKLSIRRHPDPDGNYTAQCECLGCQAMKKV